MVMIVGRGIGCRLGFSTFLPVIPVVMLLMACNDNPTPPSHAPAVPVAKSKSAAGIKWLDKRAALTPEDWLANRWRSTAVAQPPSPGKIKEDVGRAAQIFGDSPRMIANRAVQLETMLAAHGIEENAVDLIADLSTIVALEKQAEGFAARCQHYFTIRIQHKFKEEALTALKRSIIKGP